MGYLPPRAPIRLNVHRLPARAIWRMRLVVARPRPARDADIMAMTCDYHDLPVVCGEAT